MSVDEQGVITALNVAAPVREGHEDALRTLLRSLPQNGQSPLARLGTVHFGRWTLIPGWPAPGQWTLWFSVNIDGTPEDLIAGIRSHLPNEADEIWSHCVAWPGVQDGTVLTSWFLDRRIHTDHFLALYKDSTLADCERALDLRRDFARFTIWAQNREPAEVAAEFRTRFEGLGS